MSTRRNLNGMNVILFITDQERAIQHFPPGWAEKNLPGETRLRRNGLTFQRAFCNSCMCSPSRATLMTGYFPAQHGVKWTLEQNMPASQYPQAELPLDFKNIATVMASLGYATPYKGKFHLTKPANEDGVYVPEDVDRYGFQRWNPPDAGANQDPNEYGGGDADNDGRFIHDNGLEQTGDEGVLSYLKGPAATQQPFFLVVSLVNPHDVLGYPNAALQNGYDPSWLEGDIELPATVNEDLSTKPRVQPEFLALSNAGLGKLDPEQQRNYINFYGNLMKSSDRYLVRILEILSSRGLMDNTLVIKTSDHGEMGMTHGGLRQKNFNFYEETLRVPLIYSNPKLFPEPVSSEAMVSHVDFLPTLASLMDAPASARAPWQGVDYSPVVLDPSAEGRQKYIAFTYDDYQSGQPQGPYPGPRNHIISIREERYKLAKYYDAAHPDLPYEWEMYDLANDPLETRNLGHERWDRNPEQERAFRRLQLELAEVERQRLQPRPSAAAAV
ncbi:MAG TPA: sulfatase-like hydrolase/transferase [Bryobacteraceae bacterium]|nr:sulfatase-like hydrolase/transferase [Bryobacteraceae bacterium]